MVINLDGTRDGYGFTSQPLHLLFVFLQLIVREGQRPCALSCCLPKSSVGKVLHKLEAQGPVFSHLSLFLLASSQH